MCAMNNNNNNRRRWRRDANSTSVVALVALLLALLCVAQLTQGQFFTKSSSKSIPRMGRRSLVEDAPEAKAEAFKRTLIDRLVDEYGASLFTNLLESKLQQNSANNEVVTTGGGELYLRNEQPFDQARIGGGQAEQVESNMSRNERAAAADDNQQLGRQTYNKQSTKSLAMRAFNADRLLQHLSSGGSPSMGFYERLRSDTKEHSNYGD